MQCSAWGTKAQKKPTWRKDAGTLGSQGHWGAGESRWWPTWTLPGLQGRPRRARQLPAACGPSQFVLCEAVCWGSAAVPSGRMGFPGSSQMVKRPPAMLETWVWSLGQEDPLEKGMATHCSVLAWEIPWTEKPGGLQSMGLWRVGHDWALGGWFPLQSSQRPWWYSLLSSTPSPFLVWREAPPERKKKKEKNKPLAALVKPSHVVAALGHLGLGHLGRDNPVRLAPQPLGPRLHSWWCLSHLKPMLHKP